MKEIKFASHLNFNTEDSSLDVCWPRQTVFSLLLVMWIPCLAVDYRFQVKVPIKGKDSEERYIQT